MKVLIVDDNKGIRRLLKRTVLETEDTSTVLECGDGAEALACYAKNLPDVVLMDIRMPVMDGLEATRRIRTLHPCARVVIVTDYDDEDLRHAATEAGACGYSLKQNLADLIQVLHTVTGTKQN